MLQSRIKDDVFSTGYFVEVVINAAGRRLLWEQNERERDRQSRTERKRGKEGMETEGWKNAKKCVEKLLWFPPHLEAS